MLHLLGFVHLNLYLLHNIDGREVLVDVVVDHDGQMVNVGLNRLVLPAKVVLFEAQVDLKASLLSKQVNNKKGNWLLSLCLVHQDLLGNLIADFVKHILFGGVIITNKALKRLLDIICHRNDLILVIIGKESIQTFQVLVVLVRGDKHVVVKNA